MSRTITTTVTVYTFEELSADAQQKAVAEMAGRLGGEWWDQHDTEAVSEVIRYTLAHEIGTPGLGDYGVGDFPGIPHVTVDGWDLERGSYLILKGWYDRENAPKLPWVKGVASINLEAARDHTTYTVVEQEMCTCPGDEWTQSHRDTCPSLKPNPATEDQRRALIDAAKNAAHAALRDGRKEMDYKGSDAYAKEYIENGDYEFTADGSLYSS